MAEVNSSARVQDPRRSPAPRDSDHVDRVVEAIEAQVAALMNAPTFTTWLGSQRLKPDDVVAFNNTFLYRPGSVTGTTKSALYLSVRAGDDGQPQAPTRVLTHPTRINVPFRRIAAKSASDYEFNQLRDAVKNQLDGLGTIVFSVAGHIGEDQPAAVPLDLDPLVTLRYEPGQVEPLAIVDGVVSIRRMDDFAEVWEALRAHPDTNVDRNDAAHAFESALENLAEAAGRPIDITTVTAEGPSILTDVVAQLREQSESYQQLLDAYSADDTNTAAFNELLRVAYNFADGAKALVTLIVGISDLKPVLFWLTIGHQSSLAEQFDALPFASLGKTKPSLDDYRNIVSGARNRAFHNLFSFGHPLHVPLTGDAFRRPTLRLFRSYLRRNEPALTFEDRALTELLQTFTRAPERKVPLEFWQKNRSVIDAVTAVAEQLQASLALLAAPASAKQRNDS